MKFKFLIATVIIMITAIHSADAQRSVNQQRRIRQGVRSGELTKAETRNLAIQQRSTRRDMRIAKSDGIITRRERREIRRDKRYNSRAIYRKKHNRRGRI